MLKSGKKFGLGVTQSCCWQELSEHIRPEVEFFNVCSVCRLCAFHCPASWQGFWIFLINKRFKIKRKLLDLPSAFLLGHFKTNLRVTALTGSFLFCWHFSTDLGQELLNRNESFTHGTLSLIILTKSEYHWMFRCGKRNQLPKRTKKIIFIKQSSKITFKQI